VEEAILSITAKSHDVDVMACIWDRWLVPEDKPLPRILALVPIDIGGLSVFAFSGNILLSRLLYPELMSVIDYPFLLTIPVRL
jgi:hypothetical protein